MWHAQTMEKEAKKEVEDALSKAKVWNFVKVVVNLLHSWLLAPSVLGLSSTPILFWLLLRTFLEG